STENYHAKILIFTRLRNGHARQLSHYVIVSMISGDYHIIIQSFFTLNKKKRYTTNVWFILQLFLLKNNYCIASLR
ncbi:MAG: hypothetical protein LBL13_12880, partial [Bacteroidales bacterium]|nr:hypothetical protein [Bacteroidales bacterium]